MKGTYDRGVVRDLLDGKDCLSSAVHIRPSSVEELSKDGVKGLSISLYFYGHLAIHYLLLGTHLLISSLPISS